MTLIDKYQHFVIPILLATLNAELSGYALSCRITLANRNS